MGRALFFTILGTVIFLIYTYTVYRVGMIRARLRDQAQGTINPRAQQKLLREANKVMQQVTTVSSLDTNFTVLNPGDRAAIEGWLHNYERENR